MKGIEWYLAWNHGHAPRDGVAIGTIMDPKDFDPERPTTTFVVGAIDRDNDREYGQSIVLAGSHTEPGVDPDLDALLWAFIGQFARQVEAHDG